MNPHHSKRKLSPYPLSSNTKICSLLQYADVYFFKQSSFTQFTVTRHYLHTYMLNYKYNKPSATQMVSLIDKGKSEYISP